MKEEWCDQVNCAKRISNCSFEGWKERRKCHHVLRFLRIAIAMLLSLSSAEYSGCSLLFGSVLLVGSGLCTGHTIPP